MPKCVKFLYSFSGPHYGEELIDHWSARHSKVERVKHFPSPFQNSRHYSPAYSFPMDPSSSPGLIIVLLKYQKQIALAETAAINVKTVHNSALIHLVPCTGSNSRFSST